MNVPRSEALALHPDDEAGVHSNVLVFGRSHVVRQLELGRGAVNVRFGEGNARRSFGVADGSRGFGGFGLALEATRRAGTLAPLFARVGSWHCRSGVALSKRLEGGVAAVVFINHFVRKS